MARWLIVSVVLMSSLPVAAQGPSWPLAGPNLIANGSFEESPVGPVPPGQVPAGWWREAYGANGQLEIVEGGAPGQGERCLKITTTADDDKSGLHGPLIPIEPDTAYLQCGWIRAEPNSRGRYGLPYGRQFLNAEGNAVQHRKGKSYNYVPTPGVNDQWHYYEQLLMPDHTPEDSYCPDGEIPAGTTHIRIWALSYAWVGVGYYDGLGFYKVDYAAWARTDIYQRMADTDLERVVAEMSDAVEKLPAGDEVARDAAAHLQELAALKERLKAEDDRGALEWEAEHKAAYELIDTLLSTQWDVKIAALLHEADAAGNEE
ncbi:MAG: hypothetical protein J7M38_00820 [Armatimonadetes bacterium]|nr:hypothetical protein [Armatimonadota bacterium]